MVAWSDCCAVATFSNGWNCNPASLCRDRVDRDRETERRRDREIEGHFSLRLSVSLSLCLSVSAARPQCHISGGASALDEQKQRLRAGARERRFQILRGADLLTIDLLYHVARLQSGFGRGARRIDVRDHKSPRVAAESQPRGQFRRHRSDRPSETLLVARAGSGGAGGAAGCPVRKFVELGV